MSALDEYDLAIYPGFYRRPMARWNEDGSCAPMARARGPKGEAFQPLLKQSEIDEDIGHIEHEVRPPPSPAPRRRRRVSRRRVPRRDRAPTRASRARASTPRRVATASLPMGFFLARRALHRPCRLSFSRAPLTRPPPPPRPSPHADRHREEAQEEEGAPAETEGGVPPGGEGRGRVSDPRARARRRRDFCPPTAARGGRITPVAPRQTPSPPTSRVAAPFS